MQASLPQHTRHLLIDKGNSYAKVLTVDDGVYASEVICVKHLTPELLTPLCQVAPSCKLYTAYSSVGTPQPFAPAYLQEQSHYFLQLTADTPTPLKEIHYDRSQLGGDRLALAVGAYDWVGGTSDVLAIDIGTAITYEWISASGIYRGGNISPGPRTRSRSLHDATALLPEVELVGTPLPMGNNTHEAILAGIARGIIYEIVGYIQYIQSQGSSPKVILTGGYSAYFVDKVKNETFVVPDLVLRGLNSILEYNVQREIS